jgi:hypothetical protein
MTVRMLYLMFVRLAGWMALLARLITGPRHLRVVLDEYVAHYNQRRPHRARNLRSPDSRDVTAMVSDMRTAEIRRRKVLGGLINEYRWAA